MIVVTIDIIGIIAVIAICQFKISYLLPSVANQTGGV